LTPVTWGWTAGVVAPPAIGTEDGIVATEGVSLLRVTVTPPGGAGTDKVTGNATDWFGANTTPDGMPICPATFMITLAPVTFGALAVAVMVLEPSETPVTGTDTKFVFGRKFTDCGTETAPFDDCRFTVKPTLGALADSVKVIFCVPAGIFIGPGGKLNVAPTSTCLIDEV